MQIRVYYEDTDAGGIVYHTNYLKYCERARSEIFFNKGLSPVIGDSHFVVVHIDASFKASAKLGDMLDVTTVLTSNKRTSLVLTQEVLRDGVLLFCMDVTLVFTQGARPRRLTKESLELFSINKS